MLQSGGGQRCVMLQWGGGGTNLIERVHDLFQLGLYLCFRTGQWSLQF